MRELYGRDGHGEHRRQARDAATGVATDRQAANVHDAPKHAAADAAKLRILLDPEYRKSVHQAAKNDAAAADAAYAARHARPKDSAQPRSPEHAPPEAHDFETKDALAEVEARTKGLPAQTAKKRKPERSRLPLADAVKGISDIGMLITTVAVALGDAPAKWDAVAAAAVTAVVSNIAWANRRWKDRHGDRPEG